MPPVGEISHAPGDKRARGLVCVPGGDVQVRIRAAADTLLYTVRTTANKQAPAKCTQVSAGQCSH